MEMPHLRQLFDLTGKVAIVTGGSRGLGRELAEGLGEAGARVVITARKEPELVEAASYLRGRGIEVLPFAGSVTDPAAVANLVAATRTAFGQIDILVNNAGVSWGAPTLEMPPDRWQ